MYSIENYPEMTKFARKIDEAFGMQKEVELARPLEMLLPKKIVKVVDFAQAMIWPSPSNLKMAFDPPTAKTYVYNYYKGRNVLKNNILSLDENLGLYNGLVALIMPDKPDRRYTYTDELSVFIFNPVKYLDFKKGNLKVNKEDPITKDNAVFKMCFKIMYEGDGHNFQKRVNFLSCNYSANNMSVNDLFGAKQRGFYLKVNNELENELEKVPPCCVVDDDWKEGLK